MFAALGTTLVTIGLVLLALSVPLCLAGAVLLWSAKRRVYRRGDAARPAAEAAVAQGQDLDAVAKLLIASFKLPAVPAIKTLARAAGISVEEAKETVLRNLTPSRRRSLERIGPRLDRMLGNGSPT
jgi:hypothetical protein